MLATWHIYIYVHIISELLFHMIWLSYDLTVTTFSFPASDRVRIRHEKVDWEALEIAEWKTGNRSLSGRVCFSKNMLKQKLFQAPKYYISLWSVSFLHRCLSHGMRRLWCYHPAWRYLKQSWTDWRRRGPCLPCWLVIIGGYTTWFIGDYYDPQVIY